MTKYSAFGATLGMGTRQVETGTIVGTITGAGNATIIVTAAGMTGSPITKNVAVLLNDTADIVAEKVRASLLGDGNIIAWFEIGGSGAQVVLTRKIAAANDGTMNISSANGTCTGLTSQPTSDNTIAGIASANVGQIRSISGPGIALDTEDVTTHDSLEAWEEVVSTILRTGEVTLAIVYDPNMTSHAAASGLIDYAENHKMGYFKVTFVVGYDWLFSALVTKFEPDAPHEGSLTANVSLKITGKPILV